MAGYMLILILVLSAGCSSEDVIKKEKEGSVPDSQSEFGIKEVEKVFGFEGEARYAYAPGVVENEDGTVHVFFCGNPDATVFVDHIYHVKLHPGGTQTQEKSILQPGKEGEWDDQHVCDPSVVAGDFFYNGTNYKYALFYLGSSKLYYYNEIGVAFSNSLGGDEWVKYPEPIVQKSWNYEEDQLIGDYKAWGVGQPSVLSLNNGGELLLTYTVGDRNGTRIEWSLLDMGEVENFSLSIPKPMIKKGLFDLDYSRSDITKNSDFAIGNDGKTIVMVRPVLPNPSSYPAFLSKSSEIAKIDYSHFINGTGSWSQISRITPELTGYPRNHNPGLGRNQFGEIDGIDQLDFYYTTSESSPNVAPSTSLHAEWSYSIWKGTVEED